MLTHLEYVCNYCMQKIFPRHAGTYSDPVLSPNFDTSTKESKAIYRSFFFLPDPDGPAARPERDRDARCAALICRTRSCSAHRWRAVATLRGSPCDDTEWGA